MAADGSPHYDDDPLSPRSEPFFCCESSNAWQSELSTTGLHQSDARMRRASWNTDLMAYVKSLAVHEWFLDSGAVDLWLGTSQQQAVLMEDK
jgi:hypothetical protein